MSKQYNLCIHVYCDVCAFHHICVLQGKGTQKTFWLKNKSGFNFPPTGQDCNSSTKSASDVSIQRLHSSFYACCTLIQTQQPDMLYVDSLVLSHPNRRKPKQPQQRMQRIKREEQSRGAQARALLKCPKCTRLLYPKSSLNN